MTLNVEWVNQYNNDKEQNGLNGGPSTRSVLTSGSRGAHPARAADL